MAQTDKAAPDSERIEADYRAGVLLIREIAASQGITEGAIRKRAKRGPQQAYVPQSVTPAQGLMALYMLKGITEDDVLAAIATIEDVVLRYQALISYKKATVSERASMTMQTLAGLLALTEPHLDELFTKAATYTNL